MEYLSLEQVSKSYGEKILFDSINLNISQGDKIALIARNGSGKSTLLRIVGDLEAPEGERARILLNKHIKVAFLPQEPQIPPHLSVFEAFFDLDLPEINAIKKYNSAQNSGDQKALEESLARMDDLKAWDIESKSKEILYKLKLTDLDQSVGAMSGGQKKRLALAKIIISEPDFLILDEPTNHLDIEMIEWLEQYLSSSQLTLLMVTHDRYFLERLCSEIIELDKGKLFIYKGNYSDYLVKKSIKKP